MRISALCAVFIAIAGMAPSVFAKCGPFGPTVVYWGQNDNEKSLQAYCEPGQGINVIILAFISTVGNGRALTGHFGNECNVERNGGGKCDTLKRHIDYCRSRGIKLLLSVGGGGAKYGLSDKADAEKVADSLWNSWAAPNATDGSAPRPIGNSYVDGWDFDLEDNPKHSGDFLGDLVTKLRSYFPRDQEHKYVITGAPQCPLPEVNMGAAITSSIFDILFIQFYNNDQCSAYQITEPAGGTFNLDKWIHFTENTASKNATLYIGLPASRKASTDDDSGSKYFIPPDKLSQVVGKFKTNSRFGGVMLWDAGNSDTVNVNGCNYAQQVDRVLNTGVPC